MIINIFAPDKTQAYIGKPSSHGFTAFSAASAGYSESVDVPSKPRGA